MNDHPENLRNEAAKAFNESLKNLEELWEETVEQPADASLNEALLEELAAAAADIERFLAASTDEEIPQSATADDPKPLSRDQD